MSDRVGSKNFEFAITAVTIQRQVGGSLANLFDLVADTVRQRQQFGRKIRSLTAMGRMSAYTLIGLPLFLMFAISLINPGYLSPLFHTSAGHMLLIIGVVMMIVGSLRHQEESCRSRGDEVLLIVAALCLTLSALAVANVATMPARNRRARIRSAATYGNLGKTDIVERTRFSERVVGPSIGWLSRAMLRLNPKQSLESIDALLMSAGMRNWTAQAFLASKAAAGIGGVVLGFVLGSAKSAAAAFVFALILGAAGYIAPAIIVQAKARKRGNQLSGDLPDALDLLAVSVEAGLGFDAAVAKLCQYMHGPLSDEFELALNGMRIGESRSDALKKLAVRAGTPEIAAFVRAIIQADQLGTSLGRILRVQATDTRLKRQAWAEERAMKAPIKMLFPTVLFIFPAMFIVVLGPAMLSLGKLFGF